MDAEVMISVMSLFVLGHLGAVLQINELNSFIAQFAFTLCGIHLADDFIQ